MQTSSPWDETQIHEDSLNWASPGLWSCRLELESLLEPGGYVPSTVLLSLNTTNLSGVFWKHSSVTPPASFQYRSRASVPKLQNLHSYSNSLLFQTGFHQLFHKDWRPQQTQGSSRGFTQSWLDTKLGTHQFPLLKWSMAMDLVQGWFSRDEGLIGVSYSPCMKPPMKPCWWPSTDRGPRL